MRKPDKVFGTRRNHLQILADILEMCKKPQRKTNIMHCTNTSFQLLETYLLQLETSKLLELEAITNSYHTTKDGRKFIQGWINLQKTLCPQQIPPIVQNDKQAPEPNSRHSVFLIHN